MTPKPPGASRRPASILWSGRFVPLFLTQAQSAFTDNLARTSMVMLVLYGGSGRTWFVPLAGAAFVAPYAGFGAAAGLHADRFAKARVLRQTKIGEIGLAALAGAALAWDQEWFMLVALFGLGVRACYFGPVKYGILPELLPDQRLSLGNGLIEAGTFVAVLAGTLVGTVLAPRPHGRLLVGGLLAVCALMGTVTAWLVPPTEAACPDLRPPRGLGEATRMILREVRAVPAVWQAICGISWFWAMGAAYLTELPLLARAEFGADSSRVTPMLAAFSLGVGAGSLLAGLIARRVRCGRIASAGLAGMGGAALGFILLRESPTGLAALFLLAGCGGLFSVPLYVLLQRAAPPAARARAVAANNILNALAMVLVSGVLAGLAALAVDPARILLGFGLGCVGLAPWAWRSKSLNQPWAV